MPPAFAACFLTLGMVLVGLVPPGEVPDEAAHIVRSCALSYGEWIGHRVSVTTAGGAPFVTAGYTVDAGLLPVVAASTEPGHVVTRAVDDGRRTAKWTGIRVFAPTPSTAIYAPAYYLPSAAACWVGRTLGAGPLDTIFIMRGTNLLVSLALGIAALAAAARLRLCLFAVLALPGTVALAASVNPDGLLIGSSAWAVALLTRHGWVARVGAAVLLGGVCLAKPPYLPLLAILVLPEGRPTWRTLRPGLALAAAAAVPALVWSTFAAVHATVTFLFEPYAPGPLYLGPATSLPATDPAAQARILLEQPSRLLAMPLQSFRFGVLRGEVVGVLGQLDVVLPLALYRAWTAVLAASVALDTPGPQARRFPAGASVLIILCCMMTVLGIYWVQYLTWTHVGLPFVEGVQGRYLVPPLLLLALAWPSRPTIRHAPVAIAAAALTLGIAQLMIAPTLVVRHFYLR